MLFQWSSKSECLREIILCKDICGADRPRGTFFLNKDTSATNQSAIQRP